MKKADWSGRSTELCGKLCWYTEPPLLRAIVRVLDAVTTPPEWHPNNHEMVMTKARVLASFPRGAGCSLEPGEVINVSAPKGGPAMLWHLYPLRADGLDAAIREVEKHYRDHFDWARLADEPEE